MTQVMSSLGGTASDDGDDAMALQPSPDARIAVALVASQGLGAPTWAATRWKHFDRLHQALDVTGFMALTGAQFESKGQSSTIANEMYLAGKPAPGAAKRVIYRLGLFLFFRAPAAARLARIDEPSMQNKSQLMRPARSKSDWSRLKMRSHVPSLHHRLNLPYAVCHGPKRSGRSRQGAPVRKMSHRQSVCK
jgi:hypothetical protein